MQHMADGNILRKLESTCSPTFIQLFAVCKSKMPFGADSVNSPRLNQKLSQSLKEGKAFPYLQEMLMIWSADPGQAEAPVRNSGTVAVFNLRILPNIPNAGRSHSGRREDGGLHEFQRLNSGDCNWLSSAWNPCRSTCRSRCGLADWSIFFRIQHQYPVAFSGQFLQASSASWLTARRIRPVEHAFMLLV
jgi:hypothetical protein